MITPLNNPAHIIPVPVQVPVGAIIPYVGNITTANPSADYTIYPETQGWMLCDGRALNPSMYPELFTALGYLYGGANDSFSIPNLQGMFLRGVADSEASLENRKAAPNGKTNGVGSTQDFALQTHVHTYTSPNQPTTILAGDKAPSPVDPAINVNDQTGPPEQSATQSPGNVNVSQYETRPDNIFIYYLIKYTSQILYPQFHI